MAIAVALGFMILAGRSFAQTTDAAPPTIALKKLSLEELMDIEVTSVSKRPKKLSETASAIQVITNEDIRRSGATNLPEALRLADNLDVGQKNSHDWAISARGFNTELANKLLVLIDGRAVYSPLFSGVFWNAQDCLLEDIDHIEVISGPGGALWGANAVNGVINVTSKGARETQGLYLEGGGGTQLRDFGAVRYGGTLGSNVYFRVYGKYFERGHQMEPDGSAAHDSWSMGQGGFRLDSYASPDNTLTLQGDLYGSDVNIPSPSSGLGRASGGNIMGRWSHVISTDSDLSLQFYYDRTHLTDPILNQFGPVSVLTDDLNTYDLDYQQRARRGAHHQLVWGLGYRFTHDVVGQAQNLGFLPPVLDHNLFSGFGQDEIALTENLGLTLGTKLEHNDYTGFEFEPSGRLQWNFSARQMLWAAVSRAVRTPSRVDRDIREPVAPPVVLAGMPGFTSETVTAYELGYRAQPSPKVSVAVSTFYNNYDHVRSLSFTPATILPLFFENNLEGETYGLEFSANYQLLDRWRLHAGYDLLKEHLRIKPGGADLNHALSETADPQQQFSLRSSMDLPHNVEFDAGLRWVDTLHNYDGTRTGTVPSYFELDARLAWRVSQRIELSVVGQNLLHDQHPEYGFPGPAREEIQRSVYGKITWRL
jgi:iron complex outermembrane receptor protein